MFSDILLTGPMLPEKTISFSFDDGPGKSYFKNKGPNTLALAKYLQGEGIVASFFMVGHFIKKYPKIVQAVKELGHIIGAHTYSHPNMVKAFIDGKDLVAEMSKTENLLLPYTNNQPIYFRPPYGYWNAAISSNLNNDLKSANNHIGPIGWTIDAGDWMYWSKFDKDAAKKCADAYLKIITEKKSGIVLMHDSSSDRNLIKAIIRRHNNRTLDAIKIIVPTLKSLGYHFVSLNQINFLDTNSQN
jgi:peptidoglycan/xylan/chitin deacetylase (PgdA/CDA1 family)